MGSLGVARFTIARLLNHAHREVTATYDRHAYDLEKQQVLEAWGRRLDAELVADKAWSESLGR